MKNRAFTLIELLIVISVIGILSAIIIASLNNARARARDAKRMVDLKNIQTALEMYYMEHGKYPSSNGVGSTSCGSYTTVPNNAWCNSAEKNSDGRWLVNGALAPYLSEDPIDPQQSEIPLWATDNNSGGTYYYSSPSAGGGGCGSGQYYILIGGMEIVSNRKNSFRYCNGTSYSSGGSYRIGNSVL